MDRLANLVVGMVLAAALDMACISDRAKMYGWSGVGSRGAGDYFLMNLPYWLAAGVIAAEGLRLVWLRSKSRNNLRT